MCAMTIGTIADVLIYRIKNDIYFLVESTHVLKMFSLACVFVLTWPE